MGFCCWGALWLEWLWCAQAGPAVRAVRPWCVGPAGCLAVLVPRGVWLNSAKPQTTPALIRPALRSSATHKGSPSPYLWPGLRIAYIAESQQLDFTGAGFFAIFMGAIYVDLTRAICYFHAGSRQKIPHGITFYISFMFRNLTLRHLFAAAVAVVAVSAAGLLVNPDNRWLVLNGVQAQAFANEVLVGRVGLTPNWAIDVVVVSENGVVQFSEHASHRIYAYVPIVAAATTRVRWKHKIGHWYVGTFGT